MKAPWMDPGLELAALSALAALGCGLAAAQGDFLFAAIFAAASILTIIVATGGELWCCCNTLKIFKQRHIAGRIDWSHLPNVFNELGGLS